MDEGNNAIVKTSRKYARNILIKTFRSIALVAYPVRFAPGNHSNTFR